MHPLLILAIGIATILGLIILLRVHAFVALVLSAVVVSVLAPGPVSEKVTRVAVELGVATGKIGIVIAMASVIGVFMMKSGAADRIVRAFLSLLGEKRASVAVTGSAYVLAMPVFFDTVFYLLVPLARSLHRRTKKDYLLYILAIAAGGTITHTLVPPTPGPLIIASNLGVNLGLMILVGMVVALPAAAVGLMFASYLNRRMPLPMRDLPGVTPEEPIPDSRLPWLGASLLPVLLPVLLITAGTVFDATTQDLPPDSPLIRDVQPWVKLISDSNTALILAAGVSALLYWWTVRPTRAHLSELVEESLMSAGVIILITAAGGAFGAMLKTAEIGPAIQELFREQGVTGLAFLTLGFGLSSVLKIAQGSSTVAMITTSGMLAAMLEGSSGLGCHPVYLAIAVGAGSLVGSWMNDSGFWIVAKMGGLTEAETLKTWTPLLAVLGCTAMLVTTVLALLVPLN